MVEPGIRPDIAELPRELPGVEEFRPGPAGGSFPGAFSHAIRSGACSPGGRTDGVHALGVSSIHMRAVEMHVKRVCHGIAIMSV